MMFTTKHRTQFNHPRSRLRRYWNALLFLGIMYNSIMVPFRVSFDALNVKPVSYILFSVDYFVDFLLILDIIWNFFTGVYTLEGSFLLGRGDVVRTYLRGRFLLDFIAVVPIDAFVWRPINLHFYLRLTRLLALVRVPEFFRWWEWHSSSANTMRLLKMFLTVFLLSHLTACVFYAVYNTSGRHHFAEDDWGDGISVRSLGTRSTVSYVYWRSLFWTISFITGMAYSHQQPDTSLQLGVSFLFLFTGVLLFASIIGQISDIISNMNQAEQLARERMDTVNVWLKYRRLPGDISVRVRQYYEYLFSKQRGIDDQEVLGDFPVHLRRDVSAVMYADLLKKVDFFASAPPAFLLHLVLKLKPEIYGPNDSIVKAGEIGTRMYFIKSGVVRVELESGKVVSRLKEGGFFGEIAILLNKRRTASCIADTFTDVFVLARKDVHEAMKLYPVAADVIKKTAMARLQADKDKEEDRKRELAATAAMAAGVGAAASRGAAIDASIRAAGAGALINSAVVAAAVNIVTGGSSGSDSRTGSLTASRAALLEKSASAASNQPAKPEPQPAALLPLPPGTGAPEPSPAVGDGGVGVLPSPFLASPFAPPGTALPSPFVGVSSVLPSPFVAATPSPTQFAASVFTAFPSMGSPTASSAATTPASPTAASPGPFANSQVPLRKPERSQQQQRRARQGESIGSCSGGSGLRGHTRALSVGSGASLAGHRTSYQRMHPLYDFNDLDPSQSGTGSAAGDAIARVLRKLEHFPLDTLAPEAVLDAMLPALGEARRNIAIELASRAVAK